MKVAYFTGCTTNYMFPNVGSSLVNVLNANGIEVVVPKDQHCCGAPILIHGDRKTATEMAKSLVNIFSRYQVDAVITNCGTCGESFRHQFVELLKDDPVMGPKAKELGEKVYDISRFITEKLTINPEDLKPVNMKVTYHDPCHLVRGMKVKKEPRDILKMIPGVEFVEMKDADKCCGSAGSFTITHYDMAMKIHERKTENVKNSGAQALVTGCNSCRMQFLDGFHQAKMDIPTYHTIEILSKAYGF